jgi:hypothetical protein
MAAAATARQKSASLPRISPRLSVKAKPRFVPDTPQMSVSRARMVSGVGDPELWAQAPGASSVAAGTTAWYGAWVDPCGRGGPRSVSQTTPFRELTAGTGSMTICYRSPAVPAGRWASRFRRSVPRGASVRGGRGRQQEAAIQPGTRSVTFREGTSSAYTPARHGKCVALRPERFRSSPGLTSTLLGASGRHGPVPLRPAGAERYLLSIMLIGWPPGLVALRQS